MPGSDDAVRAAPGGPHGCAHRGRAGRTADRQPDAPPGGAAAVPAPPSGAGTGPATQLHRPHPPRPPRSPGPRPGPEDAGAFRTAADADPSAADATGCPPSVGVEEEFVLADRRSRVAVRKASAVLLAARSRVGAGHLVPEMAQAQLESVSAVCRSGSELHAEVVRLRTGAAAAAALQDCLLVASGTPVLGDPGPPPVLDRPRYRAIERRFGPLVRQQCVNACHVHVGVADRESAVRAVDQLRCWMPLLLALTANSPFSDGSDTGYASWRSVLWSRWPCAGPPPLLHSAERYEALVARLVSSGAALDPGMLYWHVRPSRHVPTVEVRVADVLPDAADTVAYALLVRALVARALAAVRAGEPVPDVPDMVLRAACWRAARLGLSDTLPATHAPGCGDLPATRLVEDLWTRVEPCLLRFGDTGRVGAWIERVQRSGSGAARQRAVADRHAGRLAAVVDDLAVRHP